MYKAKPEYTLNFITEMELLSSVCHIEERLPDMSIDPKNTVLESILYYYKNNPDKRPTIFRSGIPIKNLELHNFILDILILTRNNLPSYENTYNLLK